MNKVELLSRDDFREAVFARDNGKCVFCDLPAVDAHHILERRLWSDGGYYLDNGASVCAHHHMECERTAISVEDVRRACGIVNKIIPDHLYDDQVYDKWGNIILKNGTRLKGELFFDEGVQKVLGGMRSLFSDVVKYPRTFHLPWSEGVTDDDRVMDNLDAFIGKRVIVSSKLDGENTSMYSHTIHARSIDSRNHPSRNWVKAFWGNICGHIPEGWRICGENLYAKHSIEYTDLESYFYGFSIWNEYNVCLGWDETLEWFELLDIVPVPVLYNGIFCEKTIRELWNEKSWDSMEGYVVRLAESIPYSNFKNAFGKFVRKNHVMTTKHWMHGQPIVPNKLKEI